MDKKIEELEKDLKMYLLDKETLEETKNKVFDRINTTIKKIENCVRDIILNSEILSNIEWEYIREDYISIFAVKHLGQDFKEQNPSLIKIEELLRKTNDRSWGYLSIFLTSNENKHDIHLTIYDNDVSIGVNKNVDDPTPPLSTLVEFCRKYNIKIDISSITVKLEQEKKEHEETIKELEKVKKFFEEENNK